MSASVSVLSRFSAENAATNRPADRPTLTVIVPVFNEVRTIDAILKRVVAVAIEKQVIVVDDGSTDGTGERLESWAGRGITLLRQPSNRGKGAAIRTALPQAKGKYVIIQDADLEYDPRDYQRLLTPLECGAADAVYGSRYSASPDRPRPPFRWFRLGVSLLNCLTRAFYGLRLSDAATCYKVFPADVLRRMDLRCVGFEFCPEVTAKAARSGLRIVEVPIHYAGRSREEGKKIRLRDGVRAVAELWHWRSWTGARWSGAVRSDGWR